mgnify:CR=1 FL=1
MRVLLALGLVALAFPAAAEGLKFSPRAVETCLEQGGWRDCIGTAANACMEETEGGYTTPGMAGCLDAEREYWDGELNAAYGELRARAQQFDADPPIEGLPPRPSSVDALRDMQRAWIAFRDAECGFRYTYWREGTIRSLFFGSCMLDLTARRAIDLEEVANGAL